MGATAGHGVAGVRSVEHVSQVAQRFVELDQFGEQRAEGLAFLAGGAVQRGLGTGLHEGSRGDRVSFGVVGVQQVWWCPAADLGGEFPAEVDRVEQADVERGAPGGEQMRGVAGQQHAAGTVGLGEPGLADRSGQPDRCAEREFGAEHPADAGLELLQGYRRGVGW